MDASQLEAAGLLEGVEGEPARARRLDLVRQLRGHGMARLSETGLLVGGDQLPQAGASEPALGLRYAQAAGHLTPLLTPLLGYVLGVQFRDEVKRSYIMPAELSAGRFDNAREVA